ncbi:hypothetical protein HYV81_01195 [Candidatus Woesearchaeota archaeon]|nr:hypothetical protein [Candidatus Woesearchaeota archaeon]
MAKDITKECPECGSFNVIVSEKKDKVVCQDCGLIYEPLMPDDDKKLRK